MELYDTILAPLIDLRNKSIIVHGDVPADENKFNNAWEKCLYFLEIEEKMLPEFPQLEF